MVYKTLTEYHPDVFTTHGRPPTIPFIAIPALNGADADTLVLLEHKQHSRAAPLPRCFGMVAGHAESINPELLGLTTLHQPTALQKLNTYEHVPMDPVLPQYSPPTNSKPGDFVKPLGSLFRLERHDPRYIGGTRYLTEFNANEGAAETERMKRMTLPPFVPFERDEDNVVSRKAIPRAHAMVAGVPYVLQINHLAHPEYASYPLTIACFHTLPSLAYLLDKEENERMRRNTRRYCELLWGVGKREGLVNFPLKPNDRVTRRENADKKLARSKRSQSRFPDPLTVKREEDDNIENENLDFAPPQSKNDKYRGPLSASIAGTVINTGSGLFSPARQDLKPHMKAVIWETMILLRYFYLTIVPLCVSAFEWQNIQFYFLDQNSFSLGGSGPGPVSTQLNRSDTFNTWNTLDSVVDEIVKLLSDSIGFQGKLHGDINDDPAIPTLCVITFRFDETTEGAHYGGSFHLPRHGIYVADLNLLISFLVFNARDLHAGEAPGHLRFTVNNVLNALPNRQEFMRTWVSVGRFNRTCAVLYTSYKVMTRIAPTQFTPSSGYANQGATPAHQLYVQSYTKDGLHLMGDKYDRELRIMTERVYADTTTAYLSGGNPLVTLKESLEKIHVQFGGSRRNEVSLAYMSWLEIFMRRRLLSFYKELCNARLLSVSTDALRKTRFKLLNKEDAPSAPALPSSSLPAPRLIHQAAKGNPRVTGAPTLSSAVTRRAHSPSPDLAQSPAPPMSLSLPRLPLPLPPTPPEHSEEAEGSQHRHRTPSSPVPSPPRQQQEEDDSDKEEKEDEEGENNVIQCIAHTGPVRSLCVSFALSADTHPLPFLEKKSRPVSH